MAYVRNPNNIDEGVLSDAGLFTLFEMSTGHTRKHIQIETCTMYEKISEGNYANVFYVKINYPTVTKSGIEWRDWYFDTRELEDIPNIIRDIKLEKILTR